MTPSDGSTDDNISMRDYVDAMLAEHRRAVEVALEQVTEAIKKSDASAEKRHEAGQHMAHTETEDIRRQLETLNDLKANERIQVERVESLRRESQAIREAGDKAIAKAEAATEKRFEGVNAFRQQLAAQASSFMPREVADTQINDIRGKVETNANRFGDMVNRETYDASVAEWAAWRQRIVTQVSAIEGKAAGSNATIGIMLAVAGVVVSLVVLLANGTFS